VFDGNQTICLSSQLGLMKGCMLCFIQVHLGDAAAGITRVSGANVWMLGPLGTAVGYQAENMTSVYGAVKLIEVIFIVK
jgi:hypothetical protein